MLPTAGVVGKGFQPGNQIRNSVNSRDEVLYVWLQKNINTTSDTYTHERANKLVLAFGDRWQAECFPNSIYAW